MQFFSTKSVVKIAFETFFIDSKSSWLTAIGIALSKLDKSSCIPITPVENGIISSALILSLSANISQDLSVFTIPSLPVPALALPLLINMALGEFCK